MDIETPIQVLPFWTYNASSRMSRMIASITRSPFSHTGVAFRFADGRTEYFEALLSEGFRGAQNGEKLKSFALKPGNRFQTMLLHVSEGEAEGMYATALAMRGKGYGTSTLLFIAMSHRYGTPVPSSPKRLICSEAHARILYPFIDIRDIHHRTFDEVTPQSAWIRHLEIRAGYNPSAIERT
jgi:hypothetical protein